MVEGGEGKLYTGSPPPAEHDTRPTPEIDIPDGDRNKVTAVPGIMIMASAKDVKKRWLMTASGQ
jgi:hypothetical protein